MRIMYFGKNKNEGTERTAVIRFTDDEFDLYKFIENYEHTYGEPTRRFACGGLIGIERNEKGVWVNESYISVDNFTDFNDFKANYKEAKKEFNSLKKQSTEVEPESSTEVETIPVPEESAEETAKKTEIAHDMLINGITETTKTTLNPQEISTVTILTDRCECMNQYFTEIFLRDKCIGESDIFVSFDDVVIENAYCKSLMIYPEYRNKGYGIEFLRRVSCYYDGLYICPDSKNAERLYARIGYECDSPEEFESELDTHDKMYFIQPFENESNGNFSPTEIFDREEECDNWFYYHKFDIKVNRVFILKDILAKRTSVGLKKYRRYTAEITLKNIALESGLIHLMNEIKNHGFEVIESDFFGCESFIDCYVESGDRSRLCIENNESGTYIQYQYCYES